MIFQSEEHLSGKLLLFIFGFGQASIRVCKRAGLVKSFRKHEIPRLLGQCDKYGFSYIRFRRSPRFSFGFYAIFPCGTLNSCFATKEGYNITKIRYRCGGLLIPPIYNSFPSNSLQFAPGYTILSEVFGRLVESESNKACI